MGTQARTSTRCHNGRLKTQFKTCTQRFIAALFIITKRWKQPRCPSVGETINKLWCLQTTGYYSVPKRNELSATIKTWKNGKYIFLSGRSQSEKATDCMIPTL